MVLTDSHRIPRVPCYSGELYDRYKLPIQDYHLLWSSFPACSNSLKQLVEYLAVLQKASHYLAQATTAFLTLTRFRLGPRSLAAT